MGSELQWRKIMVELTFMVKAFTQNGVTGAYELPRKMLFSFSYTHDQNSIYGDMPYLAKTHWFCN
jgi:outer membrane receptor for ferrienterochelin and colicins